MYDASEALRLTGSLQTSTSEVASRSYFTRQEEVIGKWQMRACRLVSLAQIGQLWDLLGSGNDAIEAFTEGTQLVMAF